MLRHRRAEGGRAPDPHRMRTDRRGLRVPPPGADALLSGLPWLRHPAAGAPGVSRIADARPRLHPPVPLASPTRPGGGALTALMAGDYNRMFLHHCPQGGLPRKGIVTLMNFLRTCLLLSILTVLLVLVGHLMGGPSGASTAFVFALDRKST